MNSKNLILYTLVTLIWGTTWLVIKFQINSTGIVAGVFYRFILAALILFLFNLLKKNKLNYELHYHRFFILQGIFNFSVNYILTYLSEKYISSAMVALTFTTLIYYNMLGLYFFYGKKIEINAILGTIIGGLGIFLLFSEELFKTNINQQSVLGLVIGLVATFSASLGNMASIKNHQAKIPVMVFNAWSMLYGSVFSLIVGLILKDNFSVVGSLSFYSSLLYLSVFGTAIAFYAYQTLIIEIGAHKAAYTSILSPIIAVFVSMYFEKFQLTIPIILGMFLAILGNYLVLKKRSS